MSDIEMAIVMDVLDEPKNETLAEHREHCRAKPGNCPFEKDDARHSQLANEDVYRTDAKSPGSVPHATPGVPSEHTFRVTSDGKTVPANAAFHAKLMQDYDKAHRIYATSDLHTTDLDGLDIDDYGIVVIGGDFVRRDEESNASHHMTGREKKFRAEKWIAETLLPFVQKHADKQFVIIPGNHDKYFEYYPDSVNWPDNAHFLIDGEANVNGLRFYGTPWCYHHLNGAFEVGHKELAERFDKIPEGIDVLVAHSPPSDGKNDIDYDPSYNGHFGSSELADAIKDKKPKLVLCGHVHTGNHKPTQFGASTVVNVSKIGTRRTERAFAGRGIGFSKNGSGQASFFLDEDDGGQITRSAYANHGAKLSNALRDDGSIRPHSAYAVLKDAAIAINRAIDAGHFKPNPNSMGLYDYARSAILDLAKGDETGKIVKAVEEIDASKKSGYKKRITRIEAPTPPSFSDLTLDKLALIRQPQAVQRMMEINAAAQMVAKSINAHVSSADFTPNPRKVGIIDNLIAAYGKLYTGGHIKALPANDQAKAMLLRDYLVALVDARADDYRHPIRRMELLWHAPMTT